MARKTSTLARRGMAKVRSWASAGALRTFATKEHEGLGQALAVLRQGRNIEPPQVEQVVRVAGVDCQLLKKSFELVAAAAADRRFRAVDAATDFPANRAEWRPTRDRSGRDAARCPARELA